MAQEFHLSVVAPDKSVVETSVQSVVVPGVLGYLGVMAGHEPLVAALKPGLLEYVDGPGQRHYVAIGGGFTEIRGGQMTVLADDAYRAQDIDLSKAEEAVEEARRALRGESSEMGSQEATLALEKAIQRLRAARLAR